MKQTYYFQIPSGKASDERKKYVFLMSMTFIEEIMPEVCIC